MAFQERFSQTILLRWNRVVTTAFILMVCFVVHQQVVQGIEVGDEVCVEGYIMDQYCINLGVLLDNPSVVTLENPGAHSLHCLLDVGVCAASDYVVLLDPVTTSSPTTNAGATLAPTISPTGTPTTKPPTIAPTKAPILSFAELFAMLVQPSQSPSVAPTSNDDDFFSILNIPSSNVVESSAVNVEATASVTATSIYTVGYVLDDFGKQLITQIGQAVGICGTCDGSGTLRAGFRAEVRGMVTEVSTTNGPHKVAVSSVQQSNDLTTICQSPTGPTATNGVASTSPSQSPNLRSPGESGSFSRVRSVFASFFDFWA